MTPIGEYIRALIIMRLSKGPTPVEELNKAIRELVEKMGIKYDYSIWPKLVEREVVIDKGVARLTERGYWFASIALKPTLKYLENTGLFLSERLFEQINGF